MAWQNRELAENGTTTGENGGGGAEPETLEEGDKTSGREAATAAMNETAGHAAATASEQAATGNAPNTARDEPSAGQTRAGDPEMAGLTPAAGTADEAAEEEGEAAGAEAQTGGTALTDAELNRLIEELCESKAEELRLLGYDEVRGEDVWACVSEGYRKSGMPPLYRVVNDILSLKPGRFMNYITLSMYRGEGF